ncbi:hypothetical protein [Catellatospora methionotrophica]|uniref:hypothetical protein n=1 Tax=Catellatospora methionotrophica TaxID=121620 RepID=UPI0019446BEF|nr:hypothetical protein [Catellatospora methionotrophica]
MGDAYAAWLWRDYYAHTDDPAVGRCRRCWRSRCSRWAEAQALLAMAGLLEWDPFRQRLIATVRQDQ